MRSDCSRVVSLRWVGMRPLSSYTNLPDSAMTWSLGVMSRLVMYLCLCHTVTNICVALVSFIHIIHEC